jgi:hypothetical protein
MKAFATVFPAIVLGLTLVGTAPAAPIPDDARPARDGLVTPNEPHTTDSDSESPRVVTGRVLRVNADEGTIVIQTPVGVIALRGPREDLKDVSVGDIVQVEMVDGNYPSASPRLGPSEED